MQCDTVADWLPLHATPSPECGLGVDGFKDWREGDVVEVYEVVTKRLSLEEASAAEQARITERREALGVEA